MSCFKAKCAKFHFGWGFAPDPAGGTYSAPPNPLPGFKGRKDGREGQGKGEKGEEGTHF